MMSRHDSLRDPGSDLQDRKMNDIDIEQIETTLGSIVWSGFIGCKNLPGIGQV